MYNKEELDIFESMQSLFREGPKALSVKIRQEICRRALKLKKKLISVVTFASCVLLKNFFGFLFRI